MDSSVRRITWRTSDIAGIFGLAILFVFVWRFFWLVHNALFLGLISVLIAIVIAAPARLLARWVPYQVAFGVSVIGFLSLIGGTLVAVMPQVIEQVGLLAAQLPAAADALTVWIEQRTGAEPGSGTAPRVQAQLTEYVGRFVPLAFNIIGAVLSFFAVLILAIFLAAQPGVYRDLLLRAVPAGSRDRWARVYDEAGSNLKLWVIGKAVTMLLVGIATWVGLLLFGIPGALALGVLAAVLEFIPNFGPTIAAVPAVAAAFLISPMKALYVAIFYFVLQQIQSAVTVPLVERKAVNIPPAALLAWQLMLVIGFGFLGLFVATPLLAVVAVALRILYFEPAEEREAWDRRENVEPAPDPNLILPLAGAPRGGRA
ncbi:MAG: AI-2E family transporter [Gemmatimonadota bacterium]|nr:AI-2E family transporter [Gemmatimonadota bacterium]